ncbi:MAG: hypothetical protein JO123_05460 [Ktedonobacteraceae bacterium]|nr:hypothetical protein [Ktedonobacteraceae bacterium]
MHTFTLLLELVPEQQEESDPAFIHAIGRDTVETLQHDGITVQPVYTGEQGGDFLVQLATTAWDHRALIEEVLNDSSTLATLSSSIFTIITHVKHAYERRVGHAEAVASPLKITIQLNGAPITIESTNVAQVQETLTKLVQQLQNTHTGTQVSSANTLKIQPKIPKKRPRGRR